MPRGTLCDISKFEYEINHGDIVHPCVRHSEKAFKGYHWWLIYTPYYGADATMENPVLCYGISDNQEAPLKWKVYSQIVGKPSIGYNSDPTMFFNERGLNIFWRENETPRTQKDNVYRGTYACVISENDRYNMDQAILCEDSQFSDREVSPTIIKKDESYIAYAMHLRFKKSDLHSSNRYVEKLVRLFFSIVALLEIYNEQKSYGIAIWKSDSLDRPFSYFKTTKIKNCNKLYRPWHLDIFEHDNKRYAVIQTTQCNADICLAVSEDDENFTMYSKPLITNASIGKVGIYKPTAFVHKDVFYLYYTAQDLNNRSLNEMYLTSLPMAELQFKLSGS
ncbi:hypothetical protein GNY23_17625 [Labilibaculum sp. 44]|uniref:Glycosyl hydrolase family 43 n=2 Tax=Labilibaculum euxinus TaxID=2686357 RepID=A0A7M4DAF8_9BACT|nr:hypothetical protein [Labilibaculum euxinus]MVB08842.1 hypothetical protein [Labilibaculum euxinus]